MTSHEPKSMPAFAPLPQPESRRPQRSAVAADLLASYQNSGHQMQRSSSSSKLQLGAAGKRRQAAAADMPQAEGLDSLPPLDASDYDRARNMTLMFFLDKLYMASRESGEPMRLHDLSCLFGNRGFTREMRQIVGSSRNGLKKFLQSCPSLFTVDGDKVYLTELSAAAGAGGQSHDYTREAVEYFRDKLLQFGASIVPIKNLFGYRSQATQQVRHVSGQNADEFRSFLARHGDEFELLKDGEHVALKGVMAELRSTDSQPPAGETEPADARQSPRADASLTHSNVISDPYLNKQFSRVVEKSLHEMLKEIERKEADKGDSEDEQAAKANMKVPLADLHRRVLAECQNQLLAAIASTEKQFKTFLRMHPKIFKRVEGDFVALLSDAERRELENNPYAQISLSAASNKQTLLSIKTPSASASAEAPAQQIEEPASKKPLAKSPSLCVSSAASPAPSATSNTSSSSALRATAPPFVPQNITQVRRAVSNLTPSAKTALSTKLDRHQIDAKSAIRNCLAPNINNNNNHMNGLNCKPQNGFYNDLAEHPLADAASDLRARTVTVVCEASNVVSRIMTGTCAVTFDCLGSNLGSSGQITLFVLCFWIDKAETIEQKLAQTNGLVESARLAENSRNARTAGRPITGQKPEAWIFDLLLNPELAYCLKPLLECEQVIKVVHDVRNKSNALYNQFGILLSNVFDTQVANLVIQQQETGKPAYKSRYISTSKLVELYGDERLIKQRNLIKSKTRHYSASTAACGPAAKSPTKDVLYWRVRPLTNAMLHEAIMCAYCLVSLYDNLRRKIRVEYEPLLKQLNFEGVLARIKPEEIKNVRKERKIDLEVIDLKHKLYQDSDCKYIVLSNREIRLLRHIDLTPEVRAKIQQSKKVAKKLERLDQKAAQMMQFLNDSTGNESLASSSSSSSSSSASTAEATAVASTCSGKVASVGEAEAAATQQASDKSQQSSLSSNQNSFDNDKEKEDELLEMTSLMDSSMFDALREKMIESTSLLDSLQDDDDVTRLLADGSNQINSESSRSANEAINEDEQNQASHTSSTNSNTKSDSADNANSSLETTKSVDMAVQCDLIS